MWRGIPAALTFMITFTFYFYVSTLTFILLSVSTSGASESPDSGECEETRWELLGGHAPPLGHCQGEQHEAAEAEKGGERTTWKYIFQLDGSTQIIFFFILDLSFRRSWFGIWQWSRRCKNKEKENFWNFRGTLKLVMAYEYDQCQWPMINVNTDLFRILLKHSRNNRTDYIWPHQVVSCTTYEPRLKYFSSFTQTFLCIKIWLTGKCVV